MNFIHFLSQLTRILFEPYFILILPGALLAVLLNRHRRDRMFYVIAGGVIFMFLWRGCITLLSKRYSEILIFAGICFSVYFLYLFPLWLPRRFSSRLQQYVPKLKRALERCPRLFSRALVLFLVIVSILLTRNLKVDHISRRQAILELVVTMIDNFFTGLLGEQGRRYVPYLMTVALYIACANLIGVFGIKPPTKDLNVTAALALMSICLIEYSGIHARGGKGFLKSLAAPTPIMTPMNILEIAIRPTSLCMRLFGNVLGAFVIMELLKLVVPVFVPAVFSLYFDLFDGLIQTYVFVFLTSLFMKETMGDEE